MINGSMLRVGVEDGREDETEQERESLYFFLFFIFYFLFFWGERAFKGTHVNKGDRN